MEAQLFDAPLHAEQGDAKTSRVWSPYDQLDGHIKITGGNVDTISVSLLGHMRVWTVEDPDDDPVRISSGSYKVGSYKFLHQTASVAEITETTETADTAQGDSAYTASFTLTIPPRCTPKILSVPDQCLNLPPTLTVGSVLRHTDKEEYAQPRIKYSLRAIVRSKGGQVVVIEREVSVVPRCTPGPPVNISDFPGEYVGTASHSTRFSLFGRLYQMTISVPEPAPLLLQHRKECPQGNIELYIDVRNLVSERDDSTLYGLSESLKKLSFTLQPVFRAKTFYSTTPFPQVPGQDMVSAERGGVRLHDSILKLTEQSRDATSWQQQFSAGDNMNDNITDTRRGSTGIGHLEAWTTRFRFPIRVEKMVAPTFCSAIASRQYSIIGRVRVKGTTVPEFVLECPLQIYFEPAKEPTDLRIREAEEEESSLFRAQSIASAWSSDEPYSYSFLMNEDDPPPYTDR